MQLQQLPDLLHYGESKDPVRVEFDRRIGYFSMLQNHYHASCELYYLFSGERNYFVKDSAYRIRAGDLVLIDSNAVHKSTDSGIPDHERVVLYFSAAYFDEYPPEERALLRKPFTRGSALLPLNLQEKLRAEELLLSLLRELHDRPPGYRLHVRHMAGELLLLVARASGKSDLRPPLQPTPVRLKIAEIVRHINQHFAEPLELDELARRFYISRSHLSRTFKEVTGFGFAEYVNLTRVREAQRLLRETRHSVTLVSELAGFDNFSHFGKMFKRLSGASPREYRNMDRPGGAAD